MANASLYSQFPLAAHYAQHKPTIEDWKKAGYVDADGKVTPHQYVTFYIGDYDSAAWLYQFLPRIWADKARGNITLGWGFDPNLAERFTAGMDYFRRTATPNDLFVCGDSAAGYVNPGNLDGERPYSHLPSGVTTWTNFCKGWYDRFDLSVSGFVIDGDAKPMSQATAKAYASFSPDGIVGQGVTPPKLLEGTNVPSLVMEDGFAYPADLPYALGVIKNVLAKDTDNGPHFHNVRSILWKPSELLQLKQDVEKTVPNTMVVDSYTLMGLARIALTQH